MAAGDGKLVRWTGGRHFLENALPDKVLGPTIVAVVDRRRWPIGWRNVAPAASCFQHSTQFKQRFKYGEVVPIVLNTAPLGVFDLAAQVGHITWDTEGDSGAQIEKVTELLVRKLGEIRNRIKYEAEKAPFVDT
jgi:hypothetical protein